MSAPPPHTGRGPLQTATEFTVIAAASAGPGDVRSEFAEHMGEWVAWHPVTGDFPAGQSSKRLCLWLRFGSRALSSYLK